MEKQEINKKLVSGFVNLTVRRVILLAINFVTVNLILAKILPVAVIGVFDIANSILAFFTFFSDIGLAAAIIQKREITKDDLKTTFTVQEILALAILLAVWFLAPHLASLYKLNVEGMWLIRALGASFFMTSLKVIPSVLLERELKFTPIVWVEVLETAVFNGVLIFLSFHNFGVESYSFATILSSVGGLSAIYIIAPWRIAVGFSRDAMRQLLKFGIPFQLNSLLALLKDRLVPLVIAGMVGPLGVGYITWSQNIAFLPLEVMNIVIRVTFPAYSRLQEDREGLSETLERSLFMTALFLYPMLFGIVAIAPAFINYVVTAKWHPAQPLIYLFSFSAFWSPLSSTFTNFLNAIGKINITLRLMVMWTILEWTLSPLLTIFYGYYGVAIASAIISFTSIITIVIIKRNIEVDIIKSIWQPVVSSVLMGLAVLVMANRLVFNLPSLLIAILIGALLYAGLMSLIAWDKMLDTIRSVQKVK